MKVLSLKEPFATLIANNIKNIETRSFKTNYRGELYIHASKSKINNTDERTQLLIKLLPIKELSYGNIIAKCQLVDCIYMDELFINKIKKNNIEYLCGNYEIDRYAWILNDVEKLEKEIPVKGQLGIWNCK